MEVVILISLIGVSLFLFGKHVNQSGVYILTQAGAATRVTEDREGFMCDRPALVYINNLSYENMIDVRLYSDGIGIIFDKKSKKEFFLKMDKIEYTGKWPRPIRYHGKACVKMSLGDTIDTKIFEMTKMNSRANQ